jgi:hypothetical protein
MDHLQVSAHQVTGHLDKAGLRVLQNQGKRSLKLRSAQGLVRAYSKKECNMMKQRRCRYTSHGIGYRSLEELHLRNHIAKARPGERDQESNRATQAAESEGAITYLFALGL